MSPKARGKVMVLNGNMAAAQGVLLCQPDVIALFPITPSSPLSEELSRLQADGLLDAEIVEVEGENSSMSVLIGASAAGGRCFTATSSWGLAFMYDAFLFAAAQRVPVVIVNVTRETPSLVTIDSDRQDMMSVRDSGWIQIEAETSQEILDSIIMAYRLAEDASVLLPVMISYDGMFLSHLSERVEVPSKEDVAGFLAPVTKADRIKLIPGVRRGFASSLTGSGDLLTEYRYKHCEALERAKEKAEEIAWDFGQVFGRSYSGLIEQYRTEDAEIILVTMGSTAGTAKVAIDKKRDEGLAVGLVKIRMFRPFPVEKLVQALMGRKAIGVLERSVCLGWNGGHIFIELKAALSDVGIPPMVDFIGGLAGIDITVEDIEKILDTIYRVSQGDPVKKVTWLNLEQETGK